jgi:hypothetical protein
LGGPEEQPLAWIPRSYHQDITTAFRDAAAEYGYGYQYGHPPLDPEDLKAILENRGQTGCSPLQQVKSRYGSKNSSAGPGLPIPQLWVPHVWIFRHGSLLQNSIETAKSVRARLQSCRKSNKIMLGFSPCGFVFSNLQFRSG